MKTASNILEILSRIEQRIERLAQESDPLFTLRQAAEYLSIKPSYLYKLTAGRTIPFYKPAGKTIFFKKSDLDGYVLRNRISTNAEVETMALAHVARKGPRLR